MLYLHVFCEPPVKISKLPLEKLVASKYQRDIWVHATNSWIGVLWVGNHILNENFIILQER